METKPIVSTTRITVDIATSLAETIDRMVEAERANDSGVTRSTVVRRLLLQALGLKTK